MNGLVSLTRSLRVRACVAATLLSTACPNPNEPPEKIAEANSGASDQDEAPVGEKKPKKGTAMKVAPDKVAAKKAAAAASAPEASAGHEHAHLVPAKVVPKELPEIYDVKADMRKALDEHLAAAKAADHRVLVVIGGNWCTWCHKLHMLFERDASIRTRLTESYEILNVDSNANEKLLADLGVELKGVPYLVVFEPDGTIVTKQETGSLEEGPRHDPGKVLAFLDANKPAA